MAKVRLNPIASSSDVVMVHEIVLQVKWCGLKMTV
jgi:hypothetical protein